MGWILEWSMEGVKGVGEEEGWELEERDMEYVSL